MHTVHACPHLGTEDEVSTRPSLAFKVTRPGHLSVKSSISSLELHLGLLELDSLLSVTVSEQNNTEAWFDLLCQVGARVIDGSVHMLILNFDLEVVKPLCNLFKHRLLHQTEDTTSVLNDCNLRCRDLDETLVTVTAQVLL